MTAAADAPAVVGARRHRLRYSAIVRPLVAVIVSLVLFAAVLMSAGYNVGQVYTSLVEGAVGSPFALAATLRWTTALVLAGLAVALPLRAGLFNVGVEGQLYIGGFAAAWIGFSFDLPPYVAQPLALLVAAVLGAAWALLPALLRVHTRASEIVTTLMLNFVAIGFIDFLVNHFFRARLSAEALMTERVTDAARFPPLVPPYPVSYGIIVAVVLAFAVHYLLHRTSLGYDIRMIGANPSFASYGGIRVGRTWLITMAISGAIAGLIGAFETNGVNGRFITQFSPGFGFDGFLIAFLANSSPLGVIVAGLGVGGLRAGSLQMAIDFGVPRTTIAIMQGVIILLISAQLGRFGLGRIRRWQRVRHDPQS